MSLKSPEACHHPREHLTDLSRKVPTVVLEKTLESPLVCKEIKPVSPIQEISPVYSPKELMKLQYFDHLTQKADSLEKTLMLGKIEGRRRRG